MKVIFVRHGQDDDRYRGGWSSLGLLEEGRRQAQCVGWYLQAQISYNIGTIVSSDLHRTMETAAFLADALNLPVQREPRLRETNNGDLAGMWNEDALKQYPGLFFSSLGMEESYPGGESPGAFYRRVKAWFENFLEENRNNSADLVVVTHGGVINVVYHLVKGLAWSNRENRFAAGKCSIHVLDTQKLEFEVENLLVWK